MIDWVDQQLLAVARRVVKVWNWTTGLDQFFLTRCMGAFSLVYLIIVLVASTDKNAFNWTILGILSLSVFYYRIEWEMDLVKSKRSKEQWNNIKLIELERSLRLKRLYWLINTVILIIILPHYLSSPKVNYTHYNYVFDMIVVMIPIPITAIAYYFISIELPPFKKSQVLNWFRSLSFSSKSVEATVKA